MRIGRLHGARKAAHLGRGRQQLCSPSVRLRRELGTVSIRCVGGAGSMYLRQPLDTATAAYNRSAALWVAMFAFMLMPSETACSVWCQERAVVGIALLLWVAHQPPLGAPNCTDQL